MYVAFLAAMLALQPAADAAGQVIESRFFSVLRTPDGDAVRETNTIPYHPGDSCFQWMLLLRPQDRARTLQEVLQLPAPATSFGRDGEVDVQVAEDRSSARVQHRLKAGQSEIAGSWCIAPGDPLGPYRITVSDGATEIHRFEFNVVIDEIVPVT